MAYPAYKNKGTYNASDTFNVSIATYPTSIAANDILFLVVMNTLIAPNPTGWTLIENFDATANMNTYIYLYWKRADGTETGTVSLSGANYSSEIYNFSGCITTGTPYEVYTSNQEVDFSLANSLGNERLAVCITSDFNFTAQTTDTGTTGYTLMASNYHLTTNKYIDSLLHTQQIANSSTADGVVKTTPYDYVKQGFYLIPASIGTTTNSNFFNFF